MEMNHKPESEVIEAPLIMIEKFAKDWSLTPETISEIFVAGVVAFKFDGRLPDEATPTTWHVKR